jgi:hypothetical protein
MKNNLIWEYKKHDFSEIKETILKFYSIEDFNIQFQDRVEMHDSRSDIGEIINENFIVTTNYKSRWRKFFAYLNKELSSPPLETMIAFYPCYSGKIILHKESFNDLIYTKELHFFISLLGPYYSIFGLDKCMVALEEEMPILNNDFKTKKRPYEANLVLTVSPYLEFEASFIELQKKIRDYFPTFKFIPFVINRKEVEGISLDSLNLNVNNKELVFSLLYRPEKYLELQVRGDVYFGFDEWSKIKKLSKDQVDKVKEDLLRKSISIMPSNSIHKVWKFKSLNRIVKNKEANLMIGVDTIQVLDLTDKNKAVVYACYDEEPKISNYSMFNNHILLDFPQEDTSFQIKKISSNELILIMQFNLKSGEQIAVQEVDLELFFEVYS